MGGVCSFCFYSIVCFVLVLGIGDVREGSDEEHSTWSGGMKILKQEKEIKSDKIQYYEKRENNKLWK